MNTVHVDDLCRAVWYLSRRDDSLGQIYNAVDVGNTTQGTISSLVSELFDINHDYWGSALSTICKVSSYLSNNKKSWFISRPIVY